MFFDEVTLELEGGKGGDGMVFFHREKYVDEGAPDGGEGGNGGNVVLEVDENYNTLQHFTGLKHFKAQDGENGYRNNMAGHAGKDLILKVPVGTLVYDQDSRDLLVDLTKNGQRFLAALGGRGGYGNGHFMSSTRQAPDFAELGDRGGLRKLRFELRLVADVGLVGFPSSGKSTFIAHVSSARPKIASYPFTTLVPNLGVVYLSAFGGSPEQSFVIADMPGIIEGASEGKGLGDRFLKHISRTAILLYLLDPFSYEGISINDQYQILQKEIKKYDPSLLKKDFLVLLNKVDSIPDEDRKNFQKDFLNAFQKLKKKFRFVSGVSGEGLKDLLFELHEWVQKNKPSPSEMGESSMVTEYKPGVLKAENTFKIERVKRFHAPDFREPILGQMIEADLKPKRTLFKITGTRIEQIVRMTNPNQEGAIRRVYDVLKKMGIQRALIKAKAETGDIFHIGPHFFEFHDL